MNSLPHGWGRGRVGVKMVFKFPHPPFSKGGWGINLFSQGEISL